MPRTVAEIVAISRDGRAPKNDPAIFALAMAAGLGDEPTRQAALAALPDVCRTGTHLFHFATFVEEFRGWGRALRRAVGGWYAQRSPPTSSPTRRSSTASATADRTATCCASPTRARRVSAGNPQLEVAASTRALFEWIVRGGDTDGLPRLIEGYARAQTTEAPAEAAALIRDYGLPREALRSEHLDLAEVWEALLEDDADDGADPQPRDDDARRAAGAGLGAARRAVASAARRRASALRRARVHPIAVLVGAAHLRARAAACAAAARGRRSAAIVDALDARVLRGVRERRAGGQAARCSRSTCRAR